MSSSLPFISSHLNFDFFVRVAAAILVVCAFRILKNSYWMCSKEWELLWKLVQEFTVSHLYEPALLLLSFWLSFEGERFLSQLSCGYSAECSLLLLTKVRKTLPTWEHVQIGVSAYSALMADLFPSSFFFRRTPQLPYAVVYFFSFLVWDTYSLNLQKQRNQRIATNFMLGTLQKTKGEMVLCSRHWK